MASLYQSAKRSRRIIFVLLIIALLVVVNDFVGSLRKSVVLTQEEAGRFYMSANRNFGEIPIPNIVSIQRDTNDQHTYVVEGFFSEFPDVAYVYKIEEPKEKLLSFENAQNAVEVLGFAPEIYVNISGDDYKWDKLGSTSSIVYNKVSQKWSLNTEFAVFQQSNANVYANKSESSYLSAGRALYRNLGFDTFGIDSGEILVTYSEFGSDGIFYEVAQDESRFVFIDVFRKLPFADLKKSNELPTLQTGQELPNNFEGLVHKTDPRKGSISIIATDDARDSANDILDLEFTNYEYSIKTGSYLIITPQEAWTNIQLGQGSLVLIQRSDDTSLDTSDSLNVRRYVLDPTQIEVGYYEPDVWEGYVYPIYIMKGRAELEDGRLANFIFYVDAIKRI